ncbi:MAG TPA: JAB domain-containing protein [Polyangiaceae bacterium]|nr:JAB domain-containing protein [Polyangiaceae bacterium]
MDAAQIGETFVLRREPILDKSNACLHLGGLFPRHLRIVRIADEASPMKSVYLSPMKPVRTTGAPTPSRADVELTTRLREVGELVGIPLLDHVVVCTDGFISLAERNWR